MKKKYNYRISFNGLCKDGLSFQYDYGHTKNISFCIDQDCVLISFQMTVQKGPIDIVGNLLFRDALKKFFLVHTVLYGYQPELKSLEIQTDTKKLTLQNSDDNFPKIYTLLPNEPIILPESWKTREFLTFLLQTCKSKGEENQRFSSIESFLAAQSRAYEIDRFTNLWTAMNALYSHTALCCRLHIQKAYSLKEKLPEISGNDSASITLFMRLMKKKSDAPNFNAKMNQKSFRELGDQLAKMDDEQIKTLYTDARNQMILGKPSKQQLIKKYPSLEDYISDKKQIVNLELFFLLLFWFPYLCRCEFFHGRKPTILTAFSDEYEVQYLHKINIFLQCFLTKMLPKENLFDECETKILTDCYLSSIQNKNDKNKAKEILRSASEENAE